MKVHSRMACPVRNKDGSWKMVVKEFDEEIPDLGRHSMFCNKCGDPHYPDCTKFCPDAKDYIGETASQKKAKADNMCEAIEEMMNDRESKGKMEGKTEGRIEAFTGLVKDGLLSIKDAATRLNMTEDEFKSAMDKLA